MTKRILFATLFFGVIVSFGIVSKSFAQGNFIAKTAEEIIEAITKTMGKQGAKELSEYGGEKAVQKLIEKAAREGGEKAVERVLFYGRSFGISALKIIDLDPTKFIGALDKLPPNLVKPAIQATMREPEVLSQLVKEYGAQSLELAAKHPGVGTKIAEKLGGEGIRVGTNLSTDNAIKLARYSDDIAMLSSEEKRTILNKIAKTPEDIFDFMEKHPNTLRTAAGVAAFMAIKNDLFGNAGESFKNPDGSYGIKPSSSGFVERLFSNFIDKFYVPLAYSILLFAFFLALWCLVRIRHTWKISQIKQFAETAKAKSQVSHEKNI